MTVRKLIPALAALFALAIIVACGGDRQQDRLSSISPVFPCSGEYPGSPPDGAAFPATGGGVRLAEPPLRIASLSAGHTEVLYAIGAGGQVIAVDKTSDCPDAASSLPHVDAFSPSLESIVALQPDLVVLFYDPGGLVDSLAQQGIPALLLDAPSSIDGVYGQVDLLGRLTGHEAEAQGVVSDMRDAVDAISGDLSSVSAGPKVYHEVDATYYTAGPGSFVDDLYRVLKAQNIAEPSGQPFPQLSAEEIIAADPDVIVLADEDAGESAQTVSARPGWSAISAVKSGRIEPVDPDIVSRPGPRLVDALLALGKFLYPERFE
jgi:iron complex transport system substrate-binding protein